MKNSGDFKLRYRLILLMGALLAFSLICKAQVPKTDIHDIQLDDGQEMVEFLSKYVQLKSYSGDEVIAGEFILQTCESKGLYITKMGSKAGNYNFAASLFPLSLKKPNIILLNHIDVVHEGKSLAWKHEPFSGKIINGEVWGRGSYDNKGMAAMQLFGMLAFAEQHQTDDLPFNITLLCVSCEETQCAGGAQYVVNNFLEELHPAVVLGEGAPSMNNVISSDPQKNISGISLAHKGVLWLKLESNIKVSGHGSVTPLRYANQELIHSLHSLIKKNPPFILNEWNTQILKDLGKLEKGLKGFVLRHPKTFKHTIARGMRKKPELYSIFSNSITLTNIENHNEVYNKIPMQAIAYLDCRLLPQENEEDFIKYIRKSLKNDDISISVVKSMPSLNVSHTNTIYYSALKKVLQRNHPKGEVVPIILPNCNDCGVFRAKGINAYATNLYKVGREHLHAIHNVNERIPIKALKEGVKIYYGFLSELQFAP